MFCLSYILQHITNTCHTKKLDHLSCALYLTARVRHHISCDAAYLAGVSCKGNRNKSRFVNDEARLEFVGFLVSAGSKNENSNLRHAF